MSVLMTFSDLETRDVRGQIFPADFHSSFTQNDQIPHGNMWGGACFHSSARSPSQGVGARAFPQFLGPPPMPTHFDLDQPNLAE